jgi:hypothetical protein
MHNTASAIALKIGRDKHRHAEDVELSGLQSFSADAQRQI